MKTFDSILSDIDDRDFVIDPTQEEIHLQYVIKPKFLTSVKNQGIDGACSAYAATTIKEIQERRELGFRMTLSPRFIYLIRKRKDIEGMSARETFDIMKNIGCVPEKYMKRRVEKYFENYRNELLSIAEFVKISGYARAYSITAVKQSIVNHGGAYFVLPVYSQNLNFWFQHDDATLLGYHAVICIGYTNDGFIVQNSWGYEWGDGGRTVIPFDDWKYVREAWFIIDDKTTARFKRSGKIIEHDEKG